MAWKASGPPPNQDQFSRVPRKVKAVLLPFGQKGESTLVILSLSSLTSISLSPQEEIFLAGNDKIIPSEEGYYYYYYFYSSCYNHKTQKCSSFVDKDENTSLPCWDNQIWCRLVRVYFFFSNKHYSFVHSRIIAMLAGFYNPIIFVCEHKF